MVRLINVAASPSTSCSKMSFFMGAVRLVFSQILDLKSCNHWRNSSGCSPPSMTLRVSLKLTPPLGFSIFIFCLLSSLGHSFRLNGKERSFPGDAVKLDLNATFMVDLILIAEAEFVVLIITKSDYSEPGMCVHSW